MCLGPADLASLDKNPVIKFWVEIPFWVEFPPFHHVTQASVDKDKIYVR
jgi:hypothetical protein